MTISTIIINTIGIILMFFFVPLNYIPMTLNVIVIIGLLAGIWEISVSYRDNKEKVRDVGIISIIGISQLILANTVVEKFIKESGLNNRNTLMNELIINLIKAPAGTEFIFQILIFFGIAVLVTSMIGLILRR